MFILLCIYTRDDSLSSYFLFNSPSLECFHFFTPPFFFVRFYSNPIHARQHEKYVKENKKEFIFLQPSTCRNILLRFPRPFFYTSSSSSKQSWKLKEWKKKIVKSSGLFCPAVTTPYRADNLPTRSL